VPAFALNIRLLLCFNPRYAFGVNIAVIIPALNEADTLPHLISDIPQFENCTLNIIVVDNGSTDNTAQAATAAGARVVAEPRRGYGWACHAGVVAAAPYHDGVVFLDGDYSSDPKELPRLVNPLINNEADMVLGSRLTTGTTHAMLPHQAFGNWLTAILMRRMYNLRVTDIAPYRAVRLSLLNTLDLHEMTFGYPTEMLVKAARRGARLCEVPVSFLPRYAGKSKISGTVRGTILAAWFILSTTLRYAR
jgi:glycosyltransferase involved in cell wall biosynthesis